MSSDERRSPPRVTTLYLLRLRGHLELTHRGQTPQLMAEQSVAIGVLGVYLLLPDSR